MAEPNLAREAYETYLPLAMALPDDRVLEYRISPDLAIININHAMGALEKLRPRIAEHLPKIDPGELDELPALALAVKLAALRADTARPGGASLGDMIAEGWQLRRTLLPVVAGLAATGRIPRHVHDDIARGKGMRDMAEDCVALSQVFRDHAEQVAGKHSAKPETIARAEAVGSWLLQNLSKRHAPQPSPATADEVEIRDRMATLLVERYDQLRKAAHYFHGDDYGDHVPLLMSRQVPRRRAPDDAPSGEPAEPGLPCDPADPGDPGPAGEPGEPCAG